ncbi:MAG: hypothetical protein CMF59_06300 [Leptospiraceae bacterium]|nr:hypothetical protein [Leptospiraceae bacterium]
MLRNCPSVRSPGKAIQTQKGFSIDSEGTAAESLVYFPLPDPWPVHLEGGPLPDVSLDLDHIVVSVQSLLRLVHRIIL